MAKVFSTAIALRGDTFDWTRLERVRGEWRRVVSRSADLPTPAVSGAEGEPATGGEDVSRALLAQIAEPATLCMEGSQALFQCLSLPTTEASEVPEMVALQLDKVLPLPAEEMSIALEVLVTDDVGTTVLACAVPTKVILAVAMRLGLPPDRILRIDVAALCWMRLLASAGLLLDSGREVFLLAEGSGSTLLVVEGGLPVLVRSAGDVEERPDEVVQLVRLSLVQLEVERGARRLERATWVGKAFPAADLGQKMQAILGCGITMVDPERLGALSYGAALRSVSGCGFDLMPAEWRSSLADRRFRRVLFRAAGAGLLVWGLGVAALFGGPVLLERRALALEENVKVLEASSRSVRDIRHRVRMIQAYMDRTLSPLETLREISNLLPEGIELGSFRYRREDRRLSVQGTARSTPEVYEFKRKVDASALFGESALVSGPTTNPRTGFADFELLVLFREESP